MPIPVRQEDMEAVFAVTDALGIHRESITVPLGRVDPGGVRNLGGGQLRIQLPETANPQEWSQTTLKAELDKLGYCELP